MIAFIILGAMVGKILSTSKEMVKIVLNIPLEKEPLSPSPNSWIPKKQKGARVI